jgi:N-acetylglucosamine-6-sulfatase
MYKTGLMSTIALVLCLGLFVADAHAGGGKGGKTNTQPNIIFVLADDFSWNLVQYMPNVQAMQKAGMTFVNYFVTNSLCCPSRSTIFTGKLPHNTTVFINGKTKSETGGFDGFNANHDDQITFAVALSKAGYQTAMLGKYLNGYEPVLTTPIKPAPNTPKTPNPYVPTGWNEWDVAGWGYGEFDYDLNHNGLSVDTHGTTKSDYLTDVVATLGQSFIGQFDPSTHKSPAPFFIEIATFAPHWPYTPAPRDANKFPGLAAPRTPAFGARADSDAPYWLQNLEPLTPDDIEHIDIGYRMRAQSVQAIDKMIGEILCKSAQQEGMSSTTSCKPEDAATYLTKNNTNTYVFFSSDNGLHLGDYSMHQGKQTAYDIDVRVPLVVVGPKVKKNLVEKNIVMNTDLCPTFIELGNASYPDANVPPDGKSLVPLFTQTAQNPVAWRKLAFIEHHGQVYDPGAPPDPDISPDNRENPPTYAALRTTNELYIEYEDKSHEKALYDLNSDPYELHNIYSKLPLKKGQHLHDVLIKNKNCKSTGGMTCWDAQGLNADVITKP